MPISQPTFKPGQVVISGATTEKISNLNIISANNEQSFALSANLKKIIIRLREFADLKISFVATESGTKYLTIPRGCTLVLDEISFTGKILYYQSALANATVEILELS